MAKIVHFADMHFDTPFTARFSKEEAALARLGLRQVFSKIADMAKEADVLLIAGDLFDGANVSEDTLRFINRKFSELGDKRIFIVAGNHDPYPVYQKIRWSENVRVFGTEPEYVDLEDLNLRIHGISFGGEYAEAPLLDGNADLSIAPDMANILLIHGDAGAASSRYNPISEKFLESCKMDYVALGHIHKHSGVKKAGAVSYAYPGSPQGRGFDELGEHGIIVGEVHRGGAELEFVPTCESRFEILEVDIGGANDFEEIYERTLSAASAYDKTRDRIRIILRGRLSPDVKMSVGLLSKRLGETFSYIELRDESELDIDYRELASESGLRGIFVRNMLSKIDASSGEDRERYELALRYGVEAMNGGEVEVC